MSWEVPGEGGRANIHRNHKGMDSDPVVWV
jgi:hypothetical protein